MSYNRFPETKKVTVLLKVLVEGGATLFYYEQPRIKDFFSKVADKPIEPLVYKQYINSSNQVKENMEFHHYLSVNLTCKDIGLPAIEKTGYKEKDLIQLYQKYNACINPNTVATTFDGQKQQKLNFKIVAQLNRNNLEFFSSFIPDGDVIANNIAPSIGFELERILPFNGNKWGIFVAPNYYAYKVTTNKAQYSALEIPVNVRYYMFLKNNNRIFLNAGVVLNKPFIKELQMDNQNTYKVGVRVGANGGIGYAFGKWAAELRYYKPLNIMDNYLQIYTKYNKASLVLSYRL